MTQISSATGSYCEPVADDGSRHHQGQRFHASHPTKPRSRRRERHVPKWRLRRSRQLRSTYWRPTDLVAPSDMQLVLHWALPFLRAWGERAAHGTDDHCLRFPSAPLVGLVLCTRHLCEQESLYMRHFGGGFISRGIKFLTRRQGNEVPCLSCKVASNWEHERLLSDRFEALVIEA